LRILIKKVYFLNILSKIMKELINTGTFKTNSEDILFECLKNITISLFNPKGEDFRKTLCSNDSKGKETLQ